MAPLMGLFYFYIGAIFLFYVFIITGVLMISSLFLLRKTQNIKIVGNGAIFVLWATILMITWYTGPMTHQGVIKPSLIMNGGLILLAMFFLGYLWGAVWTILIFVETGVIVYLNLIQYPFPNLIPAEISEIYTLGTYLLALLMLFVFAFLYERGKMAVSMPEDKKPQILDDSKDYLEHVLDGLPIPSFVLNRDHRVTHWNRACRQLTGVRQKEILGKEIWEGFRVQDKGSIADIILEDPSFLAEKYRDSIKSISGKGWFELEIFFPKLNGGQKTIVNAAQILDRKGDLSGAIQTIQEVSGHAPPKEPQESVSTGLPGGSFMDPVFRTDPQGKICFWDQASEDQFGYSSSQMLGKSPDRLISSRFKANFKKTISDVLNGASYTNKEWTFQTNDGKQVDVLAKAYPFQPSNKMRKECVIESRDITDLKVKQKKLERHAAESKEKLKKLTEEYDLVKKNIASFIRKKDVAK